MVLLVTNTFLRSQAKSSQHRFFSASSKILPLKPPKEGNSQVGEITLQSQSDAWKSWVTPLADMSYPDQLDLKQEWVSYVVAKYKSIFLNRCQLLSRRGTPPTPNIQPICPSPIVERYRNKDSYVIREGVDGNPKTVGHVVCDTVNSKHVCVPPVAVISPQKHIEVAQAFQEYIRLSPLAACLHFSDGGFWKGITVRSNSRGELMLHVDVNPKGMTKDKLQEEQDKIKEYFVDGPGSRCELTSLYLQACPHTRCSRKVAPLHLLHGESHLVESLHGRLFKLSPTSFFQINKSMAEVLYERIISVAKLNSATTLLDLCCGIGVVSILVSSRVRGTIGIDISEEAIEDAQSNAVLNKIHSANFIPGRLEEKLSTVLEDVTQSPDMVVVLNPGRGGVYKDCIEALRKVPQIRTLIFVSCQPDHIFVVENVIKLLIPSGKRDLGMPFRLTNVIPVDMFPQTNHCEVILCFRR